MKKKFILAAIIFVAIFIIDQVVKYCFANLSWGIDGNFMSLKLAYNDGVAFSMLSFLGEYLKYVQLLIVVVGSIYLFKNKYLFKEYYISIGLLYAGGLSNILDRFTYGAVVDYFYWHYKFDFAIFNFADVMINFAVAIIVFIQIRDYRREKKKKEKTSL